MKDLEIVEEHFLWMRACTTLTDEELREVRLPSGTTQGWRWSEAADLPAGVEVSVPCADHEGRRHVIFQC